MTQPIINTAPEETATFLNYAGVITAILPALVEARAKVVEVCSSEAPPAETLVPLLAAVEHAEAAFDAALKEIHKLQQYLLYSYLPNDMDARCVSRLDTPAGNLKLADTLGAKVVDEDAAHQFFEEQGIGDLFRWQIHNATLKSAVKRLLDAGVDIPASIEVTPGSKVAFRRS